MREPIKTTVTVYERGLLSPTMPATIPEEMSDPAALLLDESQRALVRAKSYVERLAAERRARFSDD